MDYKAFFAEVAEWILKVNDMATTYTMDNEIFWNWVMKSIGEISKKYDNNSLVIAQMTMLYNWLEDVYAETKKT